MSHATLDPKQIFLEAIEQQSADDVLRYLDEACGNNVEVRSRVEALLRAHGEVGNFLGGPPDTSTTDRPVAEKPGDVIGPYKLQEQIGEGGFGVVYLAQQTEPVKRRVALKIIKPGMDTRQVVARFEAERQALALMEHPNIARVLDAGATDTGRPYFVMELVKGIPITEYCDECKLTPLQRLRLFIQVCQAVQHAHQKGIIHRDIKPTNILVAIQDGEPVPKVIDFGVAKATGLRLTNHTTLTGFTQMVGTPLYMSPEQAEMNPLDVDTRSDVYSLGVLLYELLTGTTPFERERLKEATFDELRGIIREEEPARPSARISTLGAELTMIAERRRTEPRKLRQLVKGDLDWIVLKSLEKDRTRRYETVTGLAADIQRHLADEPIEACPPSFAYRTWKFLRRNRAAVTAAAVILAGGIAVASLGILAHRRGLREEQERIARIEAERLKEIAEQERIAAEERQRQAELDALVEEALRISSGLQPDFETAEANLTEVLNERPDDAGVYLYRGSIYYRWGKPLQAIQDLERALELRPEDNLAAHQLLAIVTQQLGRNEESVEHLKLAQAAEPDSVEALVTQALALQYDEASLELMNRAIAKRPFDPLLYSQRARIALGLAFETRKPEFYRISLRDFEMYLAGRPNDDLMLGWFCQLLLWGSDLAEDPAASRERARQLLEEWLERAPYHPDAIGKLIDYYWVVGHAEKAVALLPEEQFYRQPWHVFVSLGAAYDRLGDQEKALEIFDRAVALGGPAWCYAQRARIHAKLGHQEQARRDIEETLNRSPRIDHIIYHRLCQTYEALGDDEGIIRTINERLRLAPDDAVAYERRGWAHVRLGNWNDAIADATEAIARDASGTGDYCRLRGLAYEQLGQSDEAQADFDRYLATLDETEREVAAISLWKERAEFARRDGRLKEAIAFVTEAINRDNADADALWHRGWYYRDLGDYEQALRDLDEAIRLDPDSSVALERRASVYGRLREYERAIPDAKEALRIQPTNYWAHWWLGKAYTALERYEELLEFYRTADDIDDDLAIVHYNCGRAHAGLQQWEQAAESYARAVILDPDQSEYRLSCGMANEQLGQAEEARAEFDAYIDLLSAPIEKDPHDWSAVIARANGYGGLGRWAAAIDDFEAVIAGQEDDLLSHNNLAWLLVTCPDQQFRDPARAVQLAETALRRATEQESPWEGIYRNTLGVACYRAADYQRAIRELEESEQAQPDKYLAFNGFFLAMAHWRLGHKEQAGRWFEKSVQWIEEERPDDDELRRFRTEAEQLMGIQPPMPDTDGAEKQQPSEANGTSKQSMPNQSS